MPKETFFNLKDDKKKSINKVLKEEFSTKLFKDVNVKTIVEKLDIARGSFYQYFEDLEDSYFYILENETKDMHLLFINILEENSGNVDIALDKYGIKISELIFKKDEYNLYKYRYLYWNGELEEKWRKREEDKKSVFVEKLNFELMNFIKAFIHNLIERCFRENWTKEEFIQKYNIHINWIKKGIKNANI